MRTQKEIDAEIKWLEDNKQFIPKETLFGDDNHAQIDAAIEVLREYIEEDEIDRRLDDEEWTQHEYEGARSAREWLDGEDDRKPSADDNYGGMVKRAKGT